jgi:hypothetical protein
LRASARGCHNIAVQGRQAPTGPVRHGSWCVRPKNAYDAPCLLACSARVKPWQRKARSPSRSSSCQSFHTQAFPGSWNVTEARHLRVRICALSGFPEPPLQVGKSSLLCRYTDDEFIPSDEALPTSFVRCSPVGSKAELCSRRRLQDQDDYTRR